MIAREQLVQELGQLSEEDVKRVADYVSFLKSKTRMKEVVRFDEEGLKVLYAEAGEEDRLLAEEGMPEYDTGLKKEDKQ